MHIAELASPAIAAVLDAARACRRIQADLAFDTLTKGDRSPVTVADFAAQAIVSMHLQNADPSIPLVGEEDAAELRDPANAERRARVCAVVDEVMGPTEPEAILAAIDRGVYGGGRTGRHWTLDPIDGTKGFLRGDQYAVALALIENGKVRLGVLGCPNLPHDGERGAILWAVRGEGAFARGLDGFETRQVKVTTTAAAGAARFCESVEAAHSAHGWSARVAEKLGVTRPPYRIDSQCKYAAVSQGEADIYLRLPTRKGYVEKIWDHAAGAILVEEAGGRVSDIEGRPLDFSRGRLLEDNRGVVATNGRLHDVVIEAISAVAKDG